MFKKFLNNWKKPIKIKNGLFTYGVGNDKIYSSVFMKMKMLMRIL